MGRTKGTKWANSGNLEYPNLQTFGDATYLVNSEKGRRIGGAQ